MEKLRTLNLPPHRGRDFFVTVFVDPDQSKEWLGHDYAYEDAREELLSNWRDYADQFLRNHHLDRP